MKFVAILVHFGPWPEWFDLIIETCVSNLQVKWMIFTDGEPRYARNVECVHYTLAQFEKVVKDKLDVRRNFANNSEVAEFFPAYGVLFQDFIKDYDYWINTKLPIFYGDLNKILTPHILCHDVVSTNGLPGSLNRGIPKLKNDHLTLGPLNIFKNTSHVNETLVKQPDVVNSILEGGLRLYNRPFGCGLEHMTARYHWEKGEIFYKTPDDIDSEAAYLDFSEWTEQFKNLKYKFRPIDVKGWQVSHEGIDPIW